MMASKAQIRMIWGTAHRIGMDDMNLHALVEGLTGCESIKQLNMAQAVRVIDRLRTLAGDVRDAPDRASRAQQNKIMAMAREMGWNDDPKRLRGFLEKRWTVSDVRFLTAKQAWKVIEAMKAMQKGGRTERGTRT